MLISEEELERRAAELRGRLSDWERGYLTGLVEGEAGFFLLFIKKTGYYYPVVFISNTNLRPLIYFKNKLNIGFITHERVKGNRREQYRWYIRGGDALVFIKTIFSYLFSCKKLKAALLLSINRRNKGYYAEMINKQIKKLNAYEEDLNLQPKKTGECFFEKLTEFQLGLIAGLTDGDGCIYFNREGGIYFQITNTCPRIILTLLKIIGGFGLEIIQSQRRRKLYTARLFNQKATTLLKMIRSFLLIKESQANLVLDYSETLGPRGIRVSPAVRKKREELYWKLRALNMKGRSYSGGPTSLAPSIPVLPFPLRWSLPRSLSLLDA